MREQTIDPAVKKEFHEALSGLLNNIEALKKDEKNPYFKSVYIPLPKMLEVIKPIAAKHGFVLVQPVELVNSQHGIVNVVSSRLIHSATSMAEVSQLALPTIDDMQKLGGAITYARRYTLSALCALQEVDDDGNTATGKGAKGAPKKKIPRSDDF